MLYSNHTFLRPIVPEDISELYKWLNNPQIAHFNGLPFRFNTPQAIKDYYLSLPNNMYDNYKLMFCNKENQALGILEYKQGKPIFTGVELFLQVGRIELDDVLELVNDAINLLCQYILFEIGYKRVKIVLAGKLLSLTEYLEKAGFKQEAFMREDRLVNGKYLDSICMGLLGNEFINNK